MKGRNTMPLSIVTVACLDDNYAFLAHDPASGDTTLVDVPQAGPILAELAARGWRLSQILLTHHHGDHVQDLAQVLAVHPAKVVGAAQDAHRLPPLDRAVNPGDAIAIGAQAGTVIDVPGHTIGHVAYSFPDAKVLFTGDSLMALGCGRLFEGTPAQMWASLSALAALPDDTLVCSGHEYTLTNARFAVTVDPDNPDLAARLADTSAAAAEGRATVPSLMGLERATNPFLRADQATLAHGVGMDGADPVAVFTEIRARRNAF
jgi:hydroxyacylglutathione hydrolase